MDRSSGWFCSTIRSFSIKQSAAAVTAHLKAQLSIGFEALGSYQSIISYAAGETLLPNLDQYCLDTCQVP